jgi:hypothetical protein
MRILVDMDGVVADWAAGMELALRSPDFLDWSTSCSNQASDRMA